ncbi:MAG: low molecular weight phosphatase family protein [Dehalococcoidia bacterium]
MNVLFVCNANIGRSQVAQVYFDQLSSHQSSSAGMAVDELMARQGLPSKKLKDARNQWSQEYIRQEFGVDLSERERQQLTPQLIDEADLVVVINEKANWPHYLEEGGKVVFWDIQDGLGQTDDAIYQIYAEVRQKVEDLVGEIG